MLWTNQNTAVKVSSCPATWLPKLTLYPRLKKWKQNCCFFSSFLDFGPHSAMLRTYSRLYWGITSGRLKGWMPEIKSRSTTTKTPPFWLHYCFNSRVFQWLRESPAGTALTYLVIGAEIQEAPGWIHEVGEVVEQAEACPCCVDAHLPQCSILWRYSIRQAQLQGHRHTCAQRKDPFREDALYSWFYLKIIKLIMQIKWTDGATLYSKTNI